MKSIKPRKQRKELFNAPLHRKRKQIASHLEENLLLKYDKRSVSVIKGDTVLVMRGSFRGHEDKVAKVNVKKRNLEIEGITMSKADGNKIAKPIHPSNVMITKLNLTDKWRRKKLEKGLTEETKKEIEKEAKQQIIEEEKKKAEAEAKALEEAEELGETEEDKEIEEETKDEKPEEKPVEKAKPETEKKEEKKPAPKTKPKTTKPTEKKETAVKKKTTSKKTPAKTTKKKEDK